MKKIITSFLLLAGLCATAQVKIGDNPTNINASAVLEMESTNKGLLPPRMTTAQRDAISNPSVGLMIYNTETKCTETFLGVGVSGAGTTGWKNLCKANINATFTTSTLNCAISNSLVGDYVATVAMTASNYKTVTVTTLSAGDYTVSTDEQNGVKFSAEGTISSIGAGTQLKLMASGTPTIVGTFTYTVTLSGQTCTFNVTYANPPAQIQNGTVTCTGTPAGIYNAGNIMVPGNNTATVQVTPTSIGYYSYNTNSVNGISYSASGTFTAGQVGSAQTITMQATGTPTAAGTFSYDISGTGITTSCSFNVTVTQSAYYLFARPTNSTQSINSNTDIAFTSYTNNGVEVSGTQFTLKAGKTYRLSAGLTGSASNSGAYIQFAWVDASNALLGNQGITTNTDFTNHNGYSEANAIIIVGSSDKIVKIRITAFSAGISVQDWRSFAFIEEIPINAHYVFAQPAGAQTVSSSGTDVAFTSTASNGASVSGSTFTLKANHVYRLEGNVFGAGMGTGYAEYNWVYATTNTVVSNSSNNIQVSLSNGGYHDAQSTATAIIVVGASDVTVKLRSSSVSGTTNIQGDRSYAIIQEIPASNYYLQAKLTTASYSSSGILAVTSQVANGLSVSGANITLKAGRTYLMRGCAFGTYSSAAGYNEVKWVNSTNNQIGSSNIGLRLNVSFTTHGPGADAVSIYKVGATDEVVKLNLATVNGTLNVQEYRSPIQITELR